MSWMLMHSGKVFRPATPTVEMIDIHDIAHALSHLCRFAGHTRTFYSVGEHSVRASWAAQAFDEGIQRAALLHDATEAYLVDLPSPVKMLVPAYKEIEKRLARVIEERFKMQAGILDHDIVKNIDAVMLSTERRDLMPKKGPAWENMATPMPTRIYRTMEPLEAYKAFIDRYKELFDP